MTEKKATKKVVKKTPVKKTKSKTPKSKSKKLQEDSLGDGIIIVDDDIQIDQEKVNEERRAYLEEARSQDASD